MNIKILFIISLLLLFHLNSGQDFPNISSDGELIIEWGGYDLSNIQLWNLMLKFDQTYEKDKLMMLKMNLSDNQITGISDLIVLKQYGNLQKIEINLDNDFNLTSILCLSEILPLSLKSLSVSLNSYIVITYVSRIFRQANIIPDLSVYKNLSNLSLSFQMRYLDNEAIAKIFQQLGQNVNQNLETLFIDISDFDIQYNTITNVQYLASLAKLKNFEIEVAGGIQTIDFSSIFDYVSQSNIVRFTFDYCSTYTVISQWASQLEKLNNIEELIINLYALDIYASSNECYYFDQDDLFNSVSTLTQLKRFEIPQMECFGTFNEGYCSGQSISKLGNLQQLNSLKINFTIVMINSFDAQFISQMSHLQHLDISFLTSSSNVIQQEIESDSLQTFRLSTFVNGYQPDNITFTLRIPNLENLTLNINNSMILKTPLNKLTYADLNFQNFDGSTFEYQFLQNLTYFSLQIGLSAHKYEELSQLSALPNLQEITINPADLILNYTFASSYNNMTSLKFFTQQNVSHSYIQVNQSFPFIYNIVECNEECQRCFGPQFNQCTSCNKFYLIYNECLAFCPTGYHPNTVTHRCDPDSNQNEKLIIEKI